MFRFKVPWIFGILLFLSSVFAHAHFLILYTPQTALNRSQDMDFHIIFTHAFNGTPSMEMNPPLEFYYVKEKSGSGEQQKTDLSQYLEQIQWKAGDSSVSAYRAAVPRREMRSLGDYQVVLEASPYLEVEEDIYIQQFAKIIVNVGGIPGNWDKTLGLPAEIRALNKPYANWVGGLFRGIVMADSSPVPFATVEVEYLNHALDIKNLQFEEEAFIDAPHPSFENMPLVTNQFGEFSFSLPKAGWWGFAALDIGHQKTHRGKPLSQDAVLWVQAVDIQD